MAAEGTVRTTGRIKKPKHFFDPSDYDVPRPFRASGNNSSSTTQSASNSSDRNSTGSANSDQKKANRSPSTTSTSANTSTEQVDVCSVCSKRDAKRGIHSKNKLVRCQKCDLKIHRLCLPTDFEDAELLAKNYYCTKCRKCAQCNNVLTSGQDPTKHLITCAKCVKSFHLQCHVPPVVNYQQFLRTWKCRRCMQPKPEEIREIIGGSENKSNSTNVNNNNNNNNNAEKVLKSELQQKNVAQKETIKRSAVSANEVQTPKAPPQQQQPQQQQQQQQNQQQKSKQMPGLYKYQSTQQQSLLQKPVHGSSNGQQQQQKQQPKQLQTSLIKLNPSVQQTAFTDKSVKNVSSQQTNGKAVSESGSADIGGGTKKPKLATGFSLQTPAVTSSDSGVKDEQSATANSASTTYCSTDAIDIPNNVKYWSVDKVFEYFLKYFPNEAHIFKEQEIDGMSLLLLKRSDVVKKLPIKLGPSLRLYNLILKIQAQVNDPTLGWNVGQ